jgi:hypothetical protein
MAGDYSVGNVYQGGYSTLKPSYGDVFTGYQASAKNIGMTTDPRSANQLSEISHKLNQGNVPIEAGTIAPQTFDQIPKQHFDEMRRVAKLAGAKISKPRKTIKSSK